MTKPLQHSTFAERLAYVRFLYHLETGSAPGNAEIGRAVGRIGPTVTGWMVRETPPPDYLDGEPLHDPLVGFFKPTGVTKDWLIRGVGDPPRSELWKEWIEKRRSRPTYERLAEEHGRAVTRGTSAKKPPRRKHG